MTRPDLSTLPDIILDEDEPVFNEPWEAQVFAMAINLHQHGAFEWDEWADALSLEIHSEEEDRGYYDHWLVALEKIVVAKKLTTGRMLIECEAAWHRAARATPHGEPITLSNNLVG